MCHMKLLIRKLLCKAAPGLLGTIFENALNSGSPEYSSEGSAKISYERSPPKQDCMYVNTYSDSSTTC